MGFRIFAIRASAISAKNMDVAKPNGKAMTIANMLTHKVPNIIGKIPNWAAGTAVGIHSRPAKNEYQLSLAIVIWVPWNFDCKNSFGRHVRGDIVDGKSENGIGSASQLFPIGDFSVKNIFQLHTRECTNRIALTYGNNSVFGNRAVFEKPITLPEEKQYNEQHHNTCDAATDEE